MAYETILNPANRGPTVGFEASPSRPFTVTNQADFNYRFPMSNADILDTSIRVEWYTQYSTDNGGTWTNWSGSPGIPNVFTGGSHNIDRQTGQPAPPNGSCGLQGFPLGTPTNFLCRINYNLPQRVRIGLDLEVVNG